MPIRDYTFTDLGDGQLRPMLWVRVANPQTNMIHPPVLALVDTGADRSAFPAQATSQLGHNLEAVPRKEVGTAGGITWAYPHTSRVEILEKQPDGRPGNRVLYTIADTPIDFTVGLKTFLLGTKDFLGKFVVKIDYIRKVFSIRVPQPRHPKKLKRRRKR